MFSICNCAACNAWTFDELDSDAITTIHLNSHGTTGADLAEIIERTGSEYLLLLSGPVKQLGRQTLQLLINQLNPEKLAGISPKLVNPDGLVNHCGLGFNPSGELLFPLRGQTQTESGHGAHGALPRNVSLLSPWVAVYKTEALRQISHRLHNFTTPLENSLAVCLNLLATGYRLCVDGGLSVSLETDNELQKDAPTLTALWQQFPEMNERTPSVMV